MKFFITYTSGSDVKTSDSFELLQSAVMEPIEIEIEGGTKYIVTFINDFSK